MRAPISQLSLHKLEVFCAVVEAGSVSLAAEQLGLCQPVVTTHVRSLAEKIGTSLTERQGRGLRLTEDGQHVYRWAREVVRRTREIEHEMTGRRVGRAGRAALAASMTTGSYMLPRHLVAFRRDHPEAEISLRVLSPDSVVEAVRLGDCDAAFSILDPRLDLTGLSVRRMRTEPLIAVTAPDRLPTAANVTDLGHLDFVTAQTGTARRTIEDQVLLSQGISERRVVMELGHAEAIKQAVRAGAGAAFLFAASVRDELANGSLKALDLPDLQLHVPVYSVTRTDRTLSAFQQNLLDFLSSALREEAPLS